MHDLLHLVGRMAQVHVEVDPATVLEPVLGEDGDHALGEEAVGDDHQVVVLGLDHRRAPADLAAPGRWASRRRGSSRRWRSTPRAAARCPRSRLPSVSCSARPITAVSTAEVVIDATASSRPSATGAPPARPATATVTIRSRRILGNAEAAADEVEDEQAADADDAPGQRDQRRQAARRRRPRLERRPPGASALHRQRDEEEDQRQAARCAARARSAAGRSARPSTSSARQTRRPPAPSASRCARAVQIEVVPEAGPLPAEGRDRRGRAPRSVDNTTSRRYLRRVQGIFISE